MEVHSMGLEILSNINATYREVPKEAINKTNIETNTNVQVQSSVQNIAQSETKAISNSENAKYYNEAKEEKAGKYQTAQRMKKAVENANERAKKTHCEFEYHEDTRRISISVKDNETGDVIREIPAEETLEMLSKMWELAGLFVDDKR